MSSKPSFPRQVPRFTVGSTQSGSGVLHVTIRLRKDPEKKPTIQLTDTDYWTANIYSRSLSDWRLLGEKIVHSLDKVIAGHPVLSKRHSVNIALPEGVEPHHAEQLVIGMSTGGAPYSWAQAGYAQSILGTDIDTLSKHSRNGRVRVVHIDISALEASQSVVGGEHRPPNVVEIYKNSVDFGAYLAQATVWARDLAGAPTALATPSWLGDQAKDMAAGVKGLKVRTRDLTWLIEKGFSALTALAGTQDKDMTLLSAHPHTQDVASLIEIQWDPETALGMDSSELRSTVLLTAADITRRHQRFPLPARADAAAACAAIASVVTAAQLQLPRRVIALVACVRTRHAELYPWDIVTQYGGERTAIGSDIPMTDLVLADLASYGSKKYRPSRVVTLSSAQPVAGIALGSCTGAVIGSDNFVERFMRSGERMGEQWWRLPRLPYIVDEITGTRSDWDLSKARPAVSTSAAFLKKFTRRSKHSHLDFTGPGWGWSGNNPTGQATGFAARSLVTWLYD